MRLPSSSRIAALSSVFLTALLFIPLASQARSDGTMREVESILDRLERQLLDQERRQMLPDLPSSESVERQEPSSSLEYLPTRIAPKLPDAGRLQEIATTVDQIESELSGLGGELERIKQKIRRGTQTDALIEISARLPSSDQTSLRAFEVKLDGFTIYQMNRSSGFWLPRNEIPIFTGPLSVGQHEVEFTARVVQRESEKLPIDNNVFHLYRQSFLIEVEEGSHKKGYRILLNEVDKQNLKATAKIEPYEI